MIETIEILYRDEAILIVNKPTLLLSVPGRGAAKRDSLLVRLESQLPGTLLVHRLDWETSGLMVFAQNRQAQRHLGHQFEGRAVEKGYSAVVYGRPDEEEGVIDAPLRGDWPNRPRQIVDYHCGKSAETHWRLLSSTGRSSRMALQPRSGRSHQLRVHMAHIGVPILGDPLYGSEASRAQGDRLMLHASYLAFDHPSSGEWVEFRHGAPF